MNPGSVLEVQSVTVRFGGLTALNAVSLAVPPRHVMGVIGPNGAGKTTLLNVLCGFTRPDDGQVLFGGRRHNVRPHRLAGYLAPDLRVEGRDGGQTRVAELVRPARGVLLDLTKDGAVAGAAAGWADRITVLAARLNPPDHPAPADALLIRPDGYVAWATGPGAADPSGGLDEALRTWFGAPAPTGT